MPVRNNDKAVITKNTHKENPTKKATIALPLFSDTNKSIPVSMSLHLTGVITVVALVGTTASCALRGCHESNAGKSLPTFKYNWIELKHCTGGAMGIWPNGGGLTIGE